MSSEDDKTRFAGNVTGSPVPASQAPPPRTPDAQVPAAPPAPLASPGDFLASSGMLTAPNALGPGFALGEFEIERVIGEGGFSIVYLAIDRQLVRRVAIKEYMPSSLALRNQDLTIVPKSERVRETFEAGLRSFVNEARLLAQFDHPSLVKVYRFWEERGTAYMVMPFYEGVTLTHWRRTHGAPDEAWLRRVLASVLEALAQLHGQSCYHRDIAPDNILLLPGDVPVLLDLGAARRIIGDMTQALTVILKPGYAPVEQYAEVAAMKQGAWTDLYALAAVQYYLITGRAPPPAVARMVNDELKPAVEVGGEFYSHELLAAIDATLAVLPEKRPQDIAAFRQMLGAGATQFAAGHPATAATLVPASSPGIPSVSTPAQATTAAPTQPTRAELRAAPAGSAAGPHAAASRPQTAAPSRSRTGLYAAGGALAIAVIGAVVWLMRPAPAPAPPQQTAKATKAAPPTADLSSHEMLLRVLDARSPAIEVRAASSAATMKIGRDELRFAVASNVSGYVYVLLAGTDANHLWLLFPNALDNNNRIAANTSVVLPRPEWTVTAAGPPGVNRVLVLVSPNPRDFATAGLRLGEPFSGFSLSALRAAIARDGALALAGKAVCEPSVANCDTSFGAAVFEVIEEAGTAPAKDAAQDRGTKS